MPSTALTYSSGLWTARNLIDGHEVIHQFGHIHLAATDQYRPVVIGGIWQTPQIAGAKKLRVKAGGNAADTNGGVGAWSVCVTGLNILGVRVSDVLILNGALASASTVNTYMRLLSFEVLHSGTYASQIAASHAGAIIVEAEDASADWGTIPIAPFPHGHTQFGVFTVEKGKKAYLKNYNIISDSNKIVDLLLLARPNILETVAPYTPMKTLQEFAGISELLPDEFDAHKEFDELTDFGFMVKPQTQPASVSVRMVSPGDTLPGN